MPSKGAASGKMTLSDSEVLAYSRNRYAERSLTSTMRHLSNQEQLMQDRHQREVLKWRDFRRESTKTSGVWSSPADSEFTGDQFSTEEDLAKGQLDRAHVNGSMCGSPVNSPRLNTQRGSSSARHFSNEVIRSLSFENEAVSRPQTPWAYAYSMTSYNHVYNEAVQLTRCHKNQSHSRRGSSGSSRGSSPDQKEPFRSRSSIGDVGQDVDSGFKRPLTGRSTPGLSRTVRSRNKLSLKTSIDKARPCTSVGLVRVTKNHDSVSCETKNNGQLHNHPAVSDDTVANSNATSQSISGQNSDQIHLFGKYGDDDSEDLTKKTKNASDSTSGSHSQNDNVLQLSDPNKLSTGENEEKCGVHDKNLNISLLESNSETRIDGESHLISRIGTDMHVKEQHLFQSDDKNSGSIHVESDEIGPEDECPSPTSANTPRKRIKEKKVHIRLTDNEQVDRRVSQTESSNTTTKEQSCLKDKRIKPSADGLREDLGRPLVTAAMEETASTARSSSPTQRGQKKSRESKDYKRPKAISYDSAKRRSSDTGVVRQHHDVISGSNRIGSGVLSRRYSAIDVRRRGSFMKIVDRLDALQEFRCRHMIPLDSDKEDWFENKVSGSPEEDHANLTSGKEGTVKDNVGHQLIQTKTGATDAVKTRKNSDENPSQSIKIPNRDKFKCDDPTIPRISKPCSSTKENQSDAKKNPSSDKTTQGNTETSSKFSHLEEINDNVSTSLANRTSLDKSHSSEPHYTIFKGFKIHNYIRPQERYRADPLSNLRREISSMRMSMENPTFLRENQEEGKPAIIFPKASRQKVLQELIHRHTQPARAPDDGVVPPELRAKIDDFFKTIEPYCPKPDLHLD